MSSTQTMLHFRRRISPTYGVFQVWILVIFSISQCHAFAILPSSKLPQAGPTNSRRMMMMIDPLNMIIPPDSLHDSSYYSSFLMGMEIFDGSTIVDPVVVSDVFWTSLRGKIIAVIIGQFLATIVFGAISWFIASQVQGMSNAVTNAFLSNININKAATLPTPGTFRKATDIPGFTSTTTTNNKITPDLGKLLICLTIDIVGSSSEVLPIVGEVIDVVYAPLAATVLRNLYGSNNILFGLEFAEEILPFTDILPLATICWVIDTYFSESDVAKLLKLGVYSPNYNVANNAIDVKADRIVDDKFR